jgi:hypothetical protein
MVGGMLDDAPDEALADAAAAPLRLWLPASARSHV